MGHRGEITRKKNKRLRQGVSIARRLRHGGWRRLDARKSRVEIANSKFGRAKRGVRVGSEGREGKADLSGPVGPVGSGE